MRGSACIRRTANGRCAAIVLLALSTPAGAGTMSGIGAHRCSDFLAAVERGQKPAIDGYISWAQGFISAHNWLGRGQDIAVDHHGLTYWLVDHCGTQRRDRFYAAVQAFIRRHAR